MSLTARLAYDELEKLGYLEYGKVIPSYVFESILGIECQKDWSFLGPLLELRDMLTENGYLCTQREMEFGYLKIYEVEDMAFQGNRLFDNLTKKIGKLQKCLLQAKIDELDQKELKQHLHTQNKINCCAAAMKSVLSRI